MHKKFEINWTKIKGGCQSGRKVVTHNSKSDLPLEYYLNQTVHCTFHMHLQCIMIVDLSGTLPEIQAV